MDLWGGEKTSLINLKLNHKNKYLYFLGLAFFSVFGYLFINHYPFMTPEFLPMTMVDNAIPLIPDSIWIYVSMYPMMIVAFYFLIDELEVLEKAMPAFFFLQLFSFVVFIFYPVTFPRELFPLPEGMNIFSLQIFEHIRATDKPTNCFPSLHVGNCFICSFFLWRVDKKKSVFFILWSCLIAFSTISTKQHYFYDGVFGVVMAGICYLAFFREKKLMSNPA